MTDALAPHIQHTLIASDLTLERLHRHLEECLIHGFDAAMVPANWVSVARERLAGSAVKVASAVDFPYGAMTTRGKVAEIRALVDLGVDQIDVGVPTNHLRAGLVEEYADDLDLMVRAAGRVPLKAMLDLPLLTEQERAVAVGAAVRAGFSWVKNASGGAVGVATPELVRYLRERVPATVGVKASGGIATREHAQALVDAGATLIGTSSGVAIVTGASALTPVY